MKLLETHFETKLNSLRALKLRKRVLILQTNGRTTTDDLRLRSGLLLAQRFSRRFNGALEVEAISGSISIPFLIAGDLVPGWLKASEYSTTILVVAGVSCIRPTSTSHNFLHV